MIIEGNPKHLVIGTKIDLGKRTGGQRRADVRLLAQKPMTVLRARQEAVKKAQGEAFKEYLKARDRGNTAKIMELEMKGVNLGEQERDLANAIGLKVITTRGFNPKGQ